MEKCTVQRFPGGSDSKKAPYPEIKDGVSTAQQLGLRQKLLRHINDPLISTTDSDASGLVIPENGWVIAAAFGLALVIILILFVSGRRKKEDKDQ